MLSWPESLVIVGCLFCIVTILGFFFRIFTSISGRAVRSPERVMRHVHAAQTEMIFLVGLLPSSFPQREQFISRLGQIAGHHEAVLSILSDDAPGACPCPKESPAEKVSAPS